MSEYLKIVLQNIEPIRISDDSSSQSGQTVTLRYIPGTVFRGIVVNALAKEADFEEIKKTLFSSKIRYLNAYPTKEGKELIPSPKGFYEDKTAEEGKKKLQNVVLDGEFSDGQKRAALGRFCRIENDCIYYYNINTGSDMKITINVKENEKQNVFRNEYVAANYIFTGYIAVEEEGLKDKIKNVFANDIIIGNGRSAGLGKCRVLSCGYVDGLPYQEYLAEKDQIGSCYMMLLSNTVMRDDKGELCGLNCKKLGEELGVEELEIKFCSTSVVDVKGYNSIWGVRTPSAAMYEQGSVFHLQYKGILTREKMAAVCSRGIGIRLNEGFGRVLFLDHYEEVQFKEAGQYERTPVYAAKEQYKEDQETLKIAARGYYRNLLKQYINRYVVDHPLPKGRLANSQLGTLESLATAYQYEPQEAGKAIRGYLDHADSKEEKGRVQKEKRSILELKKYVYEILDQDIEELLDIKERRQERIMGVLKKELFTSDELDKLKLELITKMIRYDYKKEEN